MKWQKRDGLAEIRRAFRYRLYPTKAQNAALHGQVNEACRLYNAALQERRDAWKLNGTSLNYHTQAKQLKTIRAAGDVGVANYGSCQDVLHRAHAAFIGFFKRVKAKKKAGYPRFKKRDRYRSITFPKYGNGCLIRANRRLYLQGVGEIKVKWHRPIRGRIKTIAVKREVGKWFVVISVICASEFLPDNFESVGIDVGLTMFATLSNGSTIKNPRFVRRAKRRMRKCHRRLDRRVVGSNGRKKALKLLQLAYRHIEHQRADFHHKTAHGLIQRYGLIAVEKLNIERLARSMLAKSVADVGWGGFLAKLIDKAENAGRSVVRVNPTGTSQICSGCGVIVAKVLRERRHRCEACGLDIPRDVNAARNILTLGLSVVGETWPTWASVPTEAVSL